MKPAFGALGDIHGDFDSVRRIMGANPKVAFWVCVGDLPGESGDYEAIAAPLYWVKGNNEDFDAIAAGRFASNLHHLPNASLTDVQGVTIAALGGTFAPSWFETAAADLPHPKKGTARATGLADKRRHFVREEVEACKGMRGVDVLMTHEAPRPYRVGRIDAGKTAVNEVLAAMQPRLHLFGHHHRFSEDVRQGVRSVGLDLASKSYLLIDVDTLAYRVEAS